MRSATVMALAVLLTGAVAQAQDVGTDAQRAAGKTIYDEKCAQCHGENGDGNGIAKHYFNPTPRDFTMGLFKIRSTNSGELPTQDDLRRVIRKGMPYTGMPAWPQLSETELDNVIYYIKLFYPDFADPDFAPTIVPAPKAPKFDEGNIEKGRALYEENKCLDCHGHSGRTNGKSAPTLENEWHEPIRPADLTRRWTFRGGSSREDIYRTFTTGLNGTPMPSYADLLDEDQRWQLVDYVYSLSRDQADYATFATASAVEGDIDISSPDAFAAAQPAFFPVVGQVIEPGRNFFPSCNGIEVRALVSATEIAVLLSWDDMTEESQGLNSPIIPVQPFDPSVPVNHEIYSDAVAMLLPGGPLKGFVKPYFMFGDDENPVEMWYVDLARGEGEVMTGKGSDEIASTGETIVTHAEYDDGQWRVAMKMPRTREGGYAFGDGVFVPVAFTVWDGYMEERGNKRGLTSWYNIYVEPAETESKAMPVAASALVALIVEFGLIAAVRRKNGANAA